jgi:hypothetical protein
MRYAIYIALCLLAVSVPSAVGEQTDLGVGSVQLLPGFAEQRTGTKDSRQGEISRKQPPFVITYDIGHMAGQHMHPEKSSQCVWFKTQLMRDQKCHVGLEKRGTDKVLTVSIVPRDDGAKTPWTYPANFWATVTNEEEIADVILIATTYLPRAEKQDGR